MTGRRVLGGLIVTTVVVCGFMGAVAIAMDDDGAEEKPASPKAPPRYQATIRSADVEDTAEERPAAAENGVSSEASAGEEKRSDGGSVTEWVTDHADGADASLLDKPIVEKVDETALHPREKQRGEETPLDPRVTEILQIRRELGINPYRGTIFERQNPTASSVGDAVRRSGDSAHGNDDGEFAAELRTAAASVGGRAHIQDRVLENRTGPTDRVRDADFVGDLRRAARRLDTKAADFEDLGLYSEADQLRRLAGRLRTTVRHGCDGTVPVLSR